MTQQYAWKQSLSYNLVDEPWIPCITSRGDFAEVSLRGLFAWAPELREIACETPIQSAAIMPLALAILHRVFGPADEDEWEALWQAGAFNMARLDEYFDTWRERFDLFHPERPFYQAIEDRVEPKSLIHLVHSIGNTATLFTHANDAAGIQLSAAEAARQLLAAQYFHTAGLGPAIHKKRASFKDSNYARGVIFWACGSTLFETLALNLVAYPDQNTMPTQNEDKPSWEMGNPFEMREVPRGYLDYLTWTNNRVQLIPQAAEDRIIVREAMIAPALNLGPGVKSPQKRYMQKKSKGEFTGEFSFLYFNSNKALWRDYASLVAERSEASRPPEVIEWLAHLKDAEAIDENRYIRLLATGMLADQTKPIFYRREIMPLPLELLRAPHYVSHIEAALSQAEKIEGSLRFALDILANEVLLRGAEGKPDPNGRRNLIKQWRVREHYWTALEPEFWRFINHLILDADNALYDWAAMLKDTALESLRHAANLAGDAPWTLKGAIAAESQLRVRMNKVLNE